MNPINRLLSIILMIILFMGLVSVTVLSEDMTVMSEEILAEKELELKDELGSDRDIVLSTSDTDVPDVTEKALPASIGSDVYIIDNDLMYRVIDEVNKLVEVTGFIDTQDTHTELNIPETIYYAKTTYTVVSIGDWAFYNYKVLASVTFPNNLKNIGEYAFYNCIKISSINLPDSLESIQEAAFFNCNLLAEVFIGRGLQSIAPDAFYKRNNTVKITYSTNSPRVQLLLLDELNLSDHPYSTWDGTEDVPARAICTVEQDINIEDAVIESGAKVTLNDITINLEGTLDFAVDTLEGKGTIIMGANANLTSTLPTGIKAQYYVRQAFPVVVRSSDIISAAINAAFNKLDSVTIDGKLLQKNVDYEVTEGSTIITLLPKYLATLPNDSYDVEITFIDGYANLTLEVQIKYIVTYTDGVADEVIFADQVSKIVVGDPTPAFVGTLERKGYTFLGWEPEVAETVTEDVTYVAQWDKIASTDPDQTDSTTRPTETITLSQSKTDKPAVPKTGESVHLMLLMIFVVTAILLMIKCIVIKKQDKNQI